MASADISPNTRYLIIDNKGNICIDRVVYPSCDKLNHDLKEQVQLLFNLNKQYLYEESIWNKLIICVENIKK